jgi:hypothetical protein
MQISQYGNQVQNYITSKTFTLPKLTEKNNHTGTARGSTSNGNFSVW